MTATQPAGSLQKNTSKILLEKVRSASLRNKQPKPNLKDWNSNIVKGVLVKTRCQNLTVNFISVLKILLLCLKFEITRLGESILCQLQYETCNLQQYLLLYLISFVMWPSLLLTLTFGIKGNKVSTWKDISLVHPNWPHIWDRLSTLTFSASFN